MKRLKRGVARRTKNETCFFEKLFSIRQLAGENRFVFQRAVSRGNWLCFANHTKNQNDILKIKNIGFELPPARRAPEGFYLLSAGFCVPIFPVRIIETSGKFHLKILNPKHEIRNKFKMGKAGNSKQRT